MNVKRFSLYRPKKLSKYLLFIILGAGALNTGYCHIEIVNTPEDVKLDEVNAKVDSVQTNIQKFENVFAKNDPNLSLIEIESTEKTTRVMLTVTNKNSQAGSYCLSDVDDANAFHIIDDETGQVYPLAKQISKISSCNKGEWYHVIEGEKVEIQLFFQRLPDTVNTIRLVEGSPNSTTISAEFSPITLKFEKNSE